MFFFRFNEKFRIFKKLNRRKRHCLAGIQHRTAGKTVFSRGFAKGLGCDDTLSSPTYTIVQEYQLPGGARLYHMDLYRIADAASALGFGVDEFIDDPKAYKLIEWPERIETLLPENCITVEITHKGDEERELRIVK